MEYCPFDAVLKCTIEKHVLEFGFSIKKELLVEDSCLLGCDAMLFGRYYQ